MKISVQPFSVACVLSLGLMSISGAGKATAQDKVKIEDASKHYESVAKHLELGGVFYGYMDVDGDIQKLTDLIDGVLNMAREGANGNIPEKLSAAGIVNELGLDSVKALGLSSRKNGAEVFHNRAFLATPAGRRGILKLLGGKAAPFLSTKLAPKGADLVIEQDLNLSVLLDIVKNILNQVGEPKSIEEFDRVLEQPMKPLSLSVGEFIKKLDTKITFIAQVDKDKKLKIEGMADPVPFVDAVIAVDRMGWVFAELKKMAAEEKELLVEEGDGFETITVIKPMPEGFADYKPLLYHEKKSGRLLIASRAEYLKTCLSGQDSVAGDEEFKKATEGLPTEGNGLSYVSSRGVKEFWNLLKIALKNEPEAQQGMLLKIYEMYLPKEGVGMAEVRANLEDGILFAGNSTDTHKSTVLTAAVYPLAFAAGLAAPMMRMQQMQQMQQAEGGAPAPNFQPDDEKATPEEKVKSNLQQVAFAAEAYFLDHEKEKEVTYTQLVKGGFLFEVDPVKGESYKDLKLKRAGGKLTLKLSGGEEITHEYPAVTD